MRRISTSPGFHIATSGSAASSACSPVFGPTFTTSTPTRFGSSVAASATVALSPNLDVRFGVIYLDRVDVKILPAGGFYYRPTPDWDMYLVFPNPKVRKFLTAIGNTKW